MNQKILFQLALLATCLGISACGTITITAKVNGESTPNNRIDASELTLTRGDLGSVEKPRLVSFAGRNESEALFLPAARLSVDVSGQPQNLSETYHFLQILTDEGTFSGGTSGQRSFVVNHVGRLFHLSRRQGNTPQETIQNQKAHVGAGWLAIVQDNDRIVPWQVDTSSSNCLALGGGDCFDMSTLTSQLFSSIAVAVDTTVPKQVPFTNVVLHRLHFVPRMVHAGHEAEGRRARGFGLIYYAEINAPTTTLKVFVPLSILFLDDIQGYRVVVDPVSFGALPPGPENLDRIYVKGTFLGGLAEGTVRDAIRDAIAATALPALLPGVAFEEVLLLGFNTAAGSNPPLSGQPPRVFPRYEAILLPEGDDLNLTSTILWESTNGTDLTERGRVRLVFME